MDGKVKFYFGEELPFSMQPIGGSAGVAAFTEGVFDTTTKPFRHVFEGPAPLKPIMVKLICAWTIRKVEWKITLSCRNCKNETKFRLEYSPKNELDNFLGEYEGFIQVELKDTDGLHGFTTQEMAVADAIGAGKNQVVFLDSAYNEKLGRLLTDGRDQVIIGTMSITLIAKADKFAVNKLMLRDEITTDVVMVPSNGVEVKCHRSFLAAQSPVFHAMFEGNMKEATTGWIEMSHMTEDGVRALLAYLYYWDESKAHGSCSVALELLEAGHSYNIPSLEKAMRKLLLSKPVSWYRVEVDAELLYFVGTLDGDEWEPLRKAVIMKK